MDRRFGLNRWSRADAKKKATPEQLANTIDHLNAVRDRSDMVDMVIADSHSRSDTSNTYPRDLPPGKDAAHRLSASLTERVVM